MDFMQNARPLDIQEAELTELAEGVRFIDTPLEELLEAEAHALVDPSTDKVFAIGGIVTDADGSNVVWLLCTKEVEVHKIKFLRYMKNLLADCLKVYSQLINVAWRGNPLNIHWLSWLGAKWHDKPDAQGLKMFSFGKPSLRKVKPRV